MLALEYLDGISCFETLRAYAGRIFRLEDHVERLSDSCRGIHQVLPVSNSGLKNWMEESLRESGITEALLRLSVHWNGSGRGKLVMIIREFQGHPARWYEKGVALATAVPRRWTLRAQDPQIKASQFMGGVLAYLDTMAGFEGSDPFDRGQTPRTPRELVFLNQSGTVAEGTTSNIFIVKEKRILTPSVGSGILRGVTREVVMGLAIQRGLNLREISLTRHDLYNAEECFLTNTSSEILPVTCFDGRVIGSGAPGPVTDLLRRDFKRVLKQWSQ